MPPHRVYVPDLATKASGDLAIGGDEARHASRVKRLVPGDLLELLDGRGTTASGEIASVERERGSWIIRVRVGVARHIPETIPAVEVWSAVPKGERVDDLIDALSQVGVAAWAPLGCERGVVEPREGKLDRLARRAEEASKQCGRAWLLRLLPGGDFAGALDGGPAIVADASGEAYHANGAERPRILIGPEGGWSAGELAQARARGATVARFGPHAMRIETAAVVASAIVLDAELRHRRG